MAAPWGRSTTPITLPSCRPAGTPTRVQLSHCRSRGARGSSVSPMPRGPGRAHSGSKAPHGRARGVFEAQPAKLPPCSQRRGKWDAKEMAPRSCRYQGAGSREAEGAPPTLRRVHACRDWLPSLSRLPFLHGPSRKFFPSLSSAASASSHGDVTSADRTSLSLPCGRSPRPDPPVMDRRCA